MSEKNSWLFRVQNASIHPSFASPSTRPLFPHSRSFVARNENKRDVLFSFHLFVSCRASWIGRARAKRGEVPSACVTSLEEISFIHSISADGRRRRRRAHDDALSERTTLGTNAALFSSSFSSSSARRSSEARRGVPCRVAVSSLVHTSSRCLEPSFFSFASFFTKTNACRDRHSHA